MIPLIHFHKKNEEVLYIRFVIISCILKSSPNSVSSRIQDSAVRYAQSKSHYNHKNVLARA